MERTGAEKELRRRAPTRAEPEMNRLDGIRNGLDLQRAANMQTDTR